MWIAPRLMHLYGGKERFTFHGLKREHGHTIVLKTQSTTWHSEKEHVINKQKKESALKGWCFCHVMFTASTCCTSAWIIKK